MHADMPVGDPTFETFWRQMLRWLTSEVPDRVSVTTGAEVVGQREAVTLRAEVGDSAYVKRNDARVIAHVVAPSGTTRDVPMDWAVDRDGEYRTTFTPDEPGLYQIKVESDVTGAARRTGGETSFTSEPVYVRANAEADAGQEFFDAEMRAPLLKRIAQETGGRFYTPETVNALPEDLALSKRGVTVVNQMDLWDMPFVFLVLVALVTSEWAYRKARGLV
jgi:hypothetical protein